MTTMVRHDACGLLVERDEFGILDPFHDKGHCRPNSAHHVQVEKPRSKWKLGRTGAGGGG